MDFGKILDQWETQGSPVYDKDRVLETEQETAAERRRRLLRKQPDATIDLHGLTQDEALDALERFFQDSKAKGLEKLLIIHGKGNHSGTNPATPAAAGEPGILKRAVQNFIERCPFAGENGYSGAADGGTGSTWVLLKAGNEEKRPG
jgi:DNA-nicking Smr family endonuclease